MSVLRVQGVLEVSACKNMGESHSGHVGVKETEAGRASESREWLLIPTVNTTVSPRTNRTS